MIVETAFKQLYPEKDFAFKASLKYSEKFNDFNANIKLRNNFIEICLSKKWADIGDEIKIGLIQHLLIRMFKDKKETVNTELYTTFVKNLAEYTAKTISEPALEESFKRVNEQYFNGFIEMPNLAFGSSATTRLGSYNYHTDTVIISRVFENEKELMDYIMYHELLHKKEKFSAKNGSTRYHTRRFRTLEKEFENKDIEKKLKIFVAKKRSSSNIFK
jgi:predicted metal-dependent hydrolase